MTQARIRASFMRGGTSKAVVFRQEDLPADRREWDAIFLAVMGSPDPNGRQLDGMGGGISSLSKVCVVGPSTRPDADVDYTFAQISVRDASVDFSANCGNMSSAIGPFAVEEGLVPITGDGEAVVRIHNTNTSKIIVSRFRVENGAAVVDGDLSIDGVAGSAAPIRLEFTDPGGAKTGRLLPSGSALNRLEVPGIGVIDASLVDAANPCVFVNAADLGKRGDELPDALEADPIFLERMEAIRRAASVHMGIAKDIDEAGRVPSIPKVAIVAAPRAMTTLSGRSLTPSDMSILVRMISIGQPHRAVPITGALCLAVAARIPGSVPNILAHATDEPIRIAHPSGVTVVDAKVSGTDSAESLHAEYGAVYRTARRLFEGAVLYRQGR
ncbi:PrpF family protein [Microvirga sp. KLBC 81]|uniref:2-methylaconitate cis-trans isomerase PrpF family protein n=1 Tax=Microvirga sp. KLBC 81 TaxID=1862707 RepID=UPI000D51F087|nr:PrpF domain-containing protein [Microvirga sp. KLBC 81]PVE24892.1 PrpF family protein [Microvirga sp. KLBC 81]